MYFAFLWMDGWLKIMEALTAEQQRIAGSRGEDQPTPSDEVANLQSALTDRERALLAALQRGKELERALTSQRDTAAERHADYLREIADRTNDVKAAEERLEAELQKAARTQAEVRRLTEQMVAAKDELAEAKKDVGRHRGELDAAKSEIERLKSALQKMQADLQGTSNESERLASEIAQARVQAERAGEHSEMHSAELARKAADAEKAAQAYQRERDEARREFDRLRAELDQARAELTSAVRSRERLESDISELRAEMQRERQIAEAERSELNRKLTEAERQMEAAPGPAEPEASFKKRRGTKSKTAEPESPAGAPAPERAAWVDDLVLHFQKPADWSERIFVYYWDTDPPTERPEWPGIPLEDEGDGWSAHRFEGIRAAKVIFNDDRDHQTRDLSRDRPGYLDADGVWHDERPAAIGKTESSPVLEAAHIPST